MKPEKVVVVVVVVFKLEVAKIAIVGGRGVAIVRAVAIVLL